MTNETEGIRKIAKEVLADAAINTDAGIMVEEELSGDKILALVSKFDVDNVNESIMKNLDDKYEFIIRPRAPPLFTFTAVSNNPYFTILHLQYILWMFFHSQIKAEILKKKSESILEQMLAVSSCGGNIDLPVYGVKVHWLGTHVQHDTVDCPPATRPWEILLLPYNIKTIHELENRVREANPFQKSTSQPLPPYMKDLLLNEEFSDIKILCEKDGTTYPAHRNILSTSSPYFQQYFTGPWSTEGGEYYKTDVDSDIFKYLLTFIYTNSFGTSLVGMPIDKLLKIRGTAQFFQMDNLVDCCTRAIYGCKTNFLLSTISIETIKDDICTAHIIRGLSSSSSSSSSQLTSGGGGGGGSEVGSDDPQELVVTNDDGSGSNNKLWTVCAELCLSKMSVLMFDRNFMSLQDENPELWNDLEYEISKLQQIMDTTSS